MRCQSVRSMLYCVLFIRKQKYSNAKSLYSCLISANLGITIIVLLPFVACAKNTETVIFLLCCLANKEELL